MTTWILVTALLALASHSVAFAELHSIQVERVFTIERETFKLTGCNDVRPCQRLGPRDSYTRQELQMFLGQSIEVERLGLLGRATVILAGIGIGGFAASCYVGPRRWLVLFPVMMVSGFLGYTATLIANARLPIIVASDESREIMSMILQHRENQGTWTIRTEVNPPRLLKFQRELNDFFSHFSLP